MPGFGENAPADAAYFGASGFGTAGFSCSASAMSSSKDSTSFQTGAGGVSLAGLAASSEVLSVVIQFNFMVYGAATGDLGNKRGSIARQYLSWNVGKFSHRSSKIIVDFTVGASDLALTRRRRQAHAVLALSRQGHLAGSSNNMKQFGSHIFKYAQPIIFCRLPE